MCHRAIEQGSRKRYLGAANANGEMVAGSKQVNEVKVIMLRH